MVDWLAFISPNGNTENASGLLFIFSSYQSLENMSVSDCRNQGNFTAVGDGRYESLFPQRPEKKEGAASQVEQRMRGEEVLK